MNTPIVIELKTSALMLAGIGRDEFEAVLKNALKAGSRPVENVVAGSMYGAEASSDQPEPEKGVQILPIIGMMTKYARYDWQSDSLDYIVPGIDDIARAIEEAETNDNIIGSVLLMNTCGGSVQSWIRIEDVLKNRKKPVVAVVDGICASAGVYVAVFCDRIYALHKTCQIGSIGVMAQLIDDKEAMKKWGYRLIEVYPPESKYKNKDIIEALKGNTGLLITEHLSPLAKHFQDTVRTYRPHLDESVEGLLEGKMFYADDAEKAGLIDGICSLKEAVISVANIANEHQDIINSIH